MNDADNKFILRTQGNRFIFADKKANTEKVNELTTKSNFKKTQFDPTSLHIQKVKQFSKKWVRKGELSKEWASDT